MNACRNISIDVGVIVSFVKVRPNMRNFVKMILLSNDVSGGISSL
jgi:hypothetical protein